MSTWTYIIVLDF